MVIFLQGQKRINMVSSTKSLELLLKILDIYTKDSQNPQFGTFIAPQRKPYFTDLILLKAILSKTPYALSLFLWVFHQNRKCKPNMKLNLTVFQVQFF